MLIPFNFNEPCILGFFIMKNNIKFPEDLLYFQHFMLIIVSVQNSDYHHPNANVGAESSVAYLLHNTVHSCGEIQVRTRSELLRKRNQA